MKPSQTYWPDPPTWPDPVIDKPVICDQETWFQLRPELLVTILYFYEFKLVMLRAPNSLHKGRVTRARVSVNTVDTCDMGLISMNGYNKYIRKFNHRLGYRDRCVEQSR